MSDLIFNTGDTVRIMGTFNDWGTPGGDLGDLIDPDTITINIRQSKAVAPTITATPTRDSLGVYYYDWDTPAENGYWVIEFVGVLDGHTMVSRQKVSVKYLNTE
jgi:hypothetical protein